MVQPDVPTASQSVVIGADEVLWSITPASAETRGELHMIAVDAKTGQPAQDVTDATVSLVGPDGAAADVPLQKLDVAHWTAPVVLGPPGRYTLRISLGTGDFDVQTGESALVVQ